MKALRLHADRDVRLDIIPDAPTPQTGEVKIKIHAVALNHIDLWGFRGMAFAKRQAILTVGAEASGTVIESRSHLKVGQRVVMYGAKTCGTCRFCLRLQDNLCENVAGVMGFHIDGFACEEVTLPARLVVPVPDGVDLTDAATVGITYSTVEHMLFDNCKLEAGETVLVHAGGSGIGTIAIKVAKALGCEVITTVGDDDKAVKALALGADHVINYRKDRFEGVVRKLTKKKGVDVVFEHVGQDTWQGSLLSLRKGGRLATCGATSGPSTTLNLMQLFQQQYKIFGSFGAPIRAIEDGMKRLKAGITPVIDTTVTLDNFNEGLARLETRQVFGKVIVKI
jgi:alcohol dehydrogenase